MEEDLISKKELLERYSISYGALYRWKRKGLIPEEWFIKKSTVTGQETFFPRTLVCERVELIQSHKEEITLNELSSKFSTEEKKKATLTLVTVFGKKTFYLSEIESAIIDDGEGNTKNISDLLK